MAAPTAVFNTLARVEHISPDYLVRRKNEKEVDSNGDCVIYMEKLLK